MIDHKEEIAHSIETRGMGKMGGSLKMGGWPSSVHYGVIEFDKSNSVIIGKNLIFFTWTDDQFKLSD